MALKRTLQIAGQCVKIEACVTEKPTGEEIVNKVSVSDRNKYSATTKEGHSSSSKRETTSKEYKAKGVCYRCWGMGGIDILAAILIAQREGRNVENVESLIIMLLCARQKE